MGMFLLLKLAFWTYVALFCAAAFFDVWKFTIPNWISMALVALFIVVGLTLPVPLDWLSQLAGMAIVLLGGMILYRFRFFGGGDLKLLAAAGLWAGTDSLAALIVLTALAGGALALALVVVRRVIVSILVAQTVVATVTLPKVLLPGEQIPYGIGIAAGAIWLGRQLPHLGLFI
ncbi:MAG: A24 family peptidase [Kiloniellales bacterium]